MNDPIESISKPEQQKILASSLANRSHITLPRVFAAITFLATLCSVAGIALMLVAKETERAQPALMEIERERMARIAYSMKDTLGQRGPTAFQVNQSMFPMTLDQLGIARFPSNGEVYHSRNNGKSIRIGGLANETLWVDNSPFILELPPLTLGVSYVITTFGDLVASTDPEILRGGRVTGREVVRKFFKAGVEHAVYLEKGANGDELLLGYQAVPGTNLVYFVEKPLAGLLNPLHEHLLNIAIGGFAIAAAIALLAYLSLRFHLRHLEAIRRYAWNRLQNSSARNIVSPALPVKSEFHVLKELLDTEARRSDAAQAMINSFSGYVQLLRSFQLRLHNSPDVQSKVIAFAEFATAALQPRPGMAKIRFHTPSVANPKACAILAISLRPDGATYAAPQWLNDPAARIILGRMTKCNSAQYDNLGAHLPIWAGDSFVGVLTFEDYPNPVHFGVLEPILSTAVMMLAENLQWSSEAVAGLLEKMNQLGIPKPTTVEGDNQTAQQGA
jgi:hypothetical protein